MNPCTSQLNAAVSSCASGPGTNACCLVFPMHMIAALPDWMLPILHGASAREHDHACHHRAPLSTIHLYAGLYATISCVAVFIVTISVASIGAIGRQLHHAIPWSDDEEIGASKLPGATLSPAHAYCSKADGALLQCLVS